MRSKDVQNTAMWSYVSPEARVPADHPLRPIREMVNAVLKTLSPEFDRIYSVFGRPSIPPERLLRALLLPGIPHMTVLFESSPNDSGRFPGSRQAEPPVRHAVNPASARRTSKTVAVWS